MLKKKIEKKKHLEMARSHPEHIETLWLSVLELWLLQLCMLQQSGPVEGEMFDGHPLEKVASARNWM